MVKSFRGHSSKHARRSATSGWLPTLVAVIIAVALIVSVALGINAVNRNTSSADGSSQSQPASSSTHEDIQRSAVPQASPSSTDSSEDADMDKARQAVDAMSMEERVGQLIMVPVCAGCDIASIASGVSSIHAGSILVTGNWNSGVAAVRQAVEQVKASTPQGIALIVATDQEGGQVQHLRGNGFSTMPSAVEQGTLDTGILRAQATQWGSELVQAGITTDLAPVVDTVTVQRNTNAPIGALSRDFGLDATGNATHAQAFMDGMHDAGVSTVIKHYPGLGGVTGNTDFTTQGIVDTTTGPDSPQIAAFEQALQSQPSMVMMSLATYTQLDANAPAAFSPTIIGQLLRTKADYSGVVISDSLSAAAVSGIDSTQLCVRLVEAGGDIACIGEYSLVAPIADGLNQRASQDSDFAQLVTQAATRVMALKYRMGLIS